MRLDKGAWVRGAVAAATFSAGISFSVTYFMIGMPARVMENALNNALSGGISAFISALVATAMYVKTLKTTGP